MGGRFLGVAAFCLALCAPARAVERPPQFVVMAFDNCTELERWKELSEFAADMNRSGEPLHFTFFVSGINFLADDKAGLYQPPNRRRGASQIGFGGTAEDVAQRVAYINDLYRNGHEIASHAVGHFDGRGWSAADWAQEFSSFRELLTNVAANNGLDSAVKFAFPPSEVIGFRAPYLDTSPGLYVALKDNSFRYDTSGDNFPENWPEKIGDLWRFNLVQLKLADSGRRALSMDYNFLAAQSGGVVDPARRDAFREEMLQTYLAYFRSNYAGNRAPLNIGHHFFDYQDGAYREALETFARMVCGLPEVRCATYAELADFMDRLDAPTLEAYRNGDFTHAAAPALNLGAGETAARAPDNESPRIQASSSLSIASRVHDFRPRALRFGGLQARRSSPSEVAETGEPESDSIQADPALRRRRHSTRIPVEQAALTGADGESIQVDPALPHRRHLTRLPPEQGGLTGAEGESIQADPALPRRRHLTRLPPEQGALTGAEGDSIQAAPALVRRPRLTRIPAEHASAAGLRVKTGSEFQSQ
jgi:peptidoglycan/xylan/chitin deacetylase (PgdA/CDA1 family)